MLKLADIAIYSPDNRLQLIAEVKGKTGATREWAAQMRRNLLAHSAIPPTRFFLLATPENFYIWKDGSGSSEEMTEPDAVVDARPIVDSYIKDTQISREQISDSSLQLILTSWLSSLVNSNLKPETLPPSEKWLFDSGLYEAIRHGSIETEASS